MALAEPRAVPRQLITRCLFTICVAGCTLSASPTPPTAATGSTAAAELATFGYQPSAAVDYADAHWDDGQGLCAEFTSRSLRAGSLNISVITYVPTLVDAFSGVPYEEHTEGDDPSANAGDVVVYSDDTGSGFCDDDSDEANCGHVCIVVIAGTGEDEITVDCHNNAHYHLALGDILGGSYSTYRVYHLSGATSPPDTVPCATDYDCNQGVSGTEDVCAAGEGYCIKGCHSDDDCSTGVCTPTQPHWSCQ